MEYLIVSVVLWSVVVGKDTYIPEIATKLANVLSEGNVNDIQQSGLTLYSYIDRLECGAERRWKGNLFTESCSNLKQMGVNQTGLYLLNDKGIAFCDMSKEWNDSDIQMMIGQIRFEEVR